MGSLCDYRVSSLALLRAWQFTKNTTPISLSWNWGFHCQYYKINKILKIFSNTIDIRLIYGLQICDPIIFSIRLCFPLETHQNIFVCTNSDIIRLHWTPDAARTSWISAKLSFPSLFYLTKKNHILVCCTLSPPSLFLLIYFL